MAENPPSSLEPNLLRLKDKDYLFQISGKFSHGMLSGLTLRSKLGQEVTYEDPNGVGLSEGFAFFSKPDDIPSCFYGATISPSHNEVRICYLGCEFMSDW